MAQRLNACDVGHHKTHTKPLAQHPDSTQIRRGSGKQEYQHGSRRNTRQQHGGSNRRRLGGTDIKWNPCDQHKQHGRQTGPVGCKRRWWHQRHGKTSYRQATKQPKAEIVQ